MSEPPCRNTQVPVHVAIIIRVVDCNRVHVLHYRQAEI